MLYDEHKAKIKREPIKNQAASYIREAILTGRFLPEERVVPALIAEELNTGRGVIREALMQLETEGLVENIPVSYTHLDVYKRQVRVCGRCFNILYMLCKSVKNG